MELAVAPEQDVLRLEVAVHEAEGVEVLAATGHGPLLLAAGHDLRALLLHATPRSCLCGRACCGGRATPRPPTPLDPPPTRGEEGRGATGAPLGHSSAAGRGADGGGNAGRRRQESGGGAPPVRRPRRGLRPPGRATGPPPAAAERRAPGGGGPADRSVGEEDGGSGPSSPESRLRRRKPATPRAALPRLAGARAGRRSTARSPLHRPLASVF